MSLENFITNMLNIQSNDIEKLDSVSKENGNLDIYIRLKPKEGVICPICNGKVNIHGYIKRDLIHSTLVNRKCNLHYMQRRYYCDECERSFSENNPFINTSENITIETKINILKDLKHAEITYSAAASRFNVTITRVCRLFDKCVQIKRKPLPEVLSIDEHYFPNSSYDSLYICILMDFNDGTIIDILPDRKNEYLKKYFNEIRNDSLNQNLYTCELDNVRYISIDLYDNYRDIAHLYFPKAVVCADSFHVIEHLTQAFRAVRLRCTRETEDEDMDYLLRKFRFVFDDKTNLDNEGKYNKRFKRHLNYRDILNILLERFPDLKKAYELKQAYLYFNSHTKADEAKEKLTEMVELFNQCEIKEYREFYNLLINWFKEIVNSFCIYNGRRINNSYIESRNRTIEVLFYNANGYSNFKRTRNRIMYCLNPKDTYKI